jgi:hypothetical protein
VLPSSTVARSVCTSGVAWAVRQWNSWADLRRSTCLRRLRVRPAHPALPRVATTGGIGHPFTWTLWSRTSWRRWLEPEALVQPLKVRCARMNGDALLQWPIHSVTGFVSSNSWVADTMKLPPSASGCIGRRITVIGGDRERSVSPRRGSCRGHGASGPWRCVLLHCNGLGPGALVLWNVHSSCAGIDSSRVGRYRLGRVEEPA